MTLYIAATYYYAYQLLFSALKEINYTIIIMIYKQLLIIIVLLEHHTIIILLFSLYTMYMRAVF